MTWRSCSASAHTFSAAGLTSTPGALQILFRRDILLASQPVELRLLVAKLPFDQLQFLGSPINGRLTFAQLFVVSINAFTCRDGQLFQAVERSRPMPKTL